MGREGGMGRREGRREGREEGEDRVDGREGMIVRE